MKFGRRKLIKNTIRVIIHEYIHNVLDEFDLLTAKQSEIAIKKMGY